MISPAGAEDEQRRALERARQRAGLTLEQLWLQYFGIGGTADLIEVEAYLHGLLKLPPVQRDMLAHAVNERLDEIRPPERAPYSHPPATEPMAGPLAALVTMLDGAHRAPPERIPALAAAAAASLGVGLGIYLVDYDQRQLVPVSTGGDPLGVDTTLAGRAFRLTQPVASEGGGRRRLWVPLIDGVERLGVLEVTMGACADPFDPGLHRHFHWLSALIGHLITVTSAYGDGLNQLRRSSPRTASAQLVWDLLRPLTAGTDRFVLAGLTEPNAAIGGDIFDYSLSERAASLAVFDAMGHSLGAGLISAAAVAAYRSAREAGADLSGQAAAIDQAVGNQFRDAFVTGVLAELDLDTGRLGYVAAGHPKPLVLRDGRVVKRLEDGRRAPLGLPISEPEPGVETLEPGDWLVLYTDGITEARDPAGDFFGETRLIDFLRREAAAGQPPPETVRRLVRSVMDHQNGVLQDDATILLAGWQATPLP